MQEQPFGAVFVLSTWFYDSLLIWQGKIYSKSSTLYSVN